jgi:hypothetical protein
VVYYITCCDIIHKLLAAWSGLLFCAGYLCVIVIMKFWDAMPYNLVYRQLQFLHRQGTRVSDMKRAGYRFREGRTVSELVTHMSAKNFERGRGKKHFW